MVATLLQWSMNVVFGCVLLAMVCCAVRLVIGPSAHDRVLALDTLWMCAMQLALVLGIRFASDMYFEAAMLIALLGFVSTIAIAKFLMRGEVIE
jgi:multicomponent K+:H+ antiporter subunit F